jgi:hypothetical protein
MLFKAFLFISMGFKKCSDNKKCTYNGWNFVHTKIRILVGKHLEHDY